MKRTLIVGLVVLSTLTLVAQVQPGDWVIANTSYNQPGLLSLRTSTNSVVPILVGPTYYPSSVMMDLDNVNLIAGDPSAQSLDFVSSTGFLTPGAILTAYPHQTCFDQDGTVLVAEDWGLYRIDPINQWDEPVWSGTYQFVHGMCIDGDTGDYIVVTQYGYFSDGRLYRINRTTLTSQLIAQNLGFVEGVDFDPTTGMFYVVNGDPFASLLRVSRNGAVVAMGPNVPTESKAVRVDPETGNILVVGRLEARLLSPQGALLQNFTLPGPMDYVGCVEIAGSREVIGSGTAVAGSSYDIDFNFPNCANQPYIAALSTSMRPGYPLNDGTGRIVNLEQNFISQLTLGGLPGVVDGFQGVLDASGHADGVIHLPSWVPPGFRIFVTAVALNPAMPSGIDTANTWGFTTN